MIVPLDRLIKNYETVDHPAGLPKEPTGEVAAEVADSPTTITPYRNGPYLVRGPFAIVDQGGNEIESKRRVVALCRCGRSQIRPFCDGTHKTIGFKADSGPPIITGGPGGVQGGQESDG